MAAIGLLFFTTPTLFSILILVSKFRPTQANPDDDLACLPINIFGLYFIREATSPPVVELLLVL